MSNRVPLVAIVGRTNVGKSTLFNALAKRRLAVVEDSPGVTRDRHYTLIKHYGDPFTLVDTGGLVGEESQDVEGEIRPMHELVRAQSQIAIDECDLVVVVFDGLHGPHSLDSDVVEHLRRANKKTIWVVNKCERPLTEVLSAEFYALGVGELHCVSAANRIGIQELGREILTQLGLQTKSSEEKEKKSDVEEIYEDETTEEIVSENGVVETKELDPIRVAVIGRPNVGKSSLVNRILGEERLVASDMPGTTRDSIDIELVRDGQKFVIVDTAGLRKKNKVNANTVERFSNLRTLRALAGCDVALLVLDATLGMPGEQEKKIAELINERGRGFVIVVNKWDAVEKDHRTVHAFTEGVYNTMPFARYAPILFVSALSGRRCPSLLEKAKQVAISSKLRIQTGALNTLLERIFQRRPPPVIRGEPVKLYFATQVSAAPPTIVMFLNHPDEIKQSYVRYIKTMLRKEYPFEGVDLKLELRKRTEKDQRKRDTA